jgi:hypothetical protein
MPWPFRRKQPRTPTEAQALAQQMGMPGSAAAYGSPEQFFANDWEVSFPANPTVIAVGSYGRMLDQALAAGDPVSDLGPEELDSVHAAAQALASVRPPESHFMPVHNAALEFLQARITHAVERGRYSAALYNSNDLNLVDRLRSTKEFSEVVMNRKLASLQAAMRQLNQSSAAWFETLELQDHTLTWLYLDDIVDSRPR